MLSQLVQIKWLLAVFVGFLVVRAAFRVWWEFKGSGGMDALLSNHSGFAARAQALLDQGRHADLVALAQERCAQCPGDALAFWCHATAAYRVGKIADAIVSLRKTQELQPDWGATHVRPFIEAIEAQGVASARSAGLYVVPTAAPNRVDLLAHLDWQRQRWRARARSRMAAPAHLMQCGRDGGLAASVWPPASRRETIRSRFRAMAWVVFVIATFWACSPAFADSPLNE
jgi:hypothetical protein